MVAKLGIGLRPQVPALSISHLRNTIAIYISLGVVGRKKNRASRAMSYGPEWYIDHARKYLLWSSLREDYNGIFSLYIPYGVGEIKFNVWKISDRETPLTGHYVLSLVPLY